MNTPSNNASCPASESKVNFRKYAIILNEPSRTESVIPQQLLSDSRVPTLTQEELLPTDETTYEDIGQLSRMLQEKIKLHAGVEAALFSCKEIIQDNVPALVPLKFRLAVEEFTTTCNESNFKIIECRHETKESSNWEPTLTDTLIDRMYQVIVVDVKESFLPYNIFAYAILRQLHHEWRLKMPRSLFHPNDVCSLETTLDRSLIMLVPSMPDGDLELSRIENQPCHYQLFTMFKLCCMSALKYYLRMRELKLRKFEDIVAAVAGIRTIYRRVQRRLCSGQEIDKESDFCMELIDEMKSIMSANLATASAVTKIGQRLFNFEKDKSQESQNEGDSPLLENIQKSQSQEGDQIPGSDTISHEGQFSSMSAAEAQDLPAQFAMLDVKLKTQFERIEKMLSGNCDFYEAKNKMEKSFEKLPLPNPAQTISEYDNEN